MAKKETAEKDESKVVAKCDNLYEGSLDEHLGYKIHVVFAAAYVARDLHQGQKDKGGNDDECLSRTNE